MHVCLLYEKHLRGAYTWGMPGQTFSHCKKITDVAAIIKHVYSEEEKQLQKVAGSVRVGELAAILGGQARAPQWIGKGWEDRDLPDPGDPEAVTLALGVSARKQTRVQAYSCIMDVPKGFSLAVASDPQLRAWFNETVRPKMTDAYMSALEAEAVVKRGGDKARSYPRAQGLRGWWAGHSISGAGDPHLHNHLIISATAQTADGHVGQIDSDWFLGRGAKLADAAAKRVMMEEAATVGLRFGLDGELLGVDTHLIEAASNAHNAVSAIKTYFGSEGTPVSDEQAWKHWRQIAEGKEDKGLPESLIEQIRKSRGEGTTLGAEDLEHSLDAALGDAAKAVVVGRWLAGKYGLEQTEWVGLADRARAAAEVEPKYSEVDRVIGLIETLKSAPTVIEVEALCARIVDDDSRADLMERVGLDPRILVGDKHWALKNTYTREIALRERVEKLLAGGNHGGEVVAGLVDLDSPLIVISGVAGAGKTTHLLEAKDAWAEAGVTVWAAARNRLTATETGKAAGVKQSLSLASLRRRVERGAVNTPQPGDVLVIDEFGLVDSREVTMLLDLAELGVKIKLLGDSHQIQPIDQSPDARLVIDLARTYGARELTQSYRTEAWSELHRHLRRTATGFGSAEKTLERMDIREAASAQGVVDILAGAGGQVVVQTNAIRVAIAEALPRPGMPTDRSGEPVIAMLRDGIAGWDGDTVVVRKNIWESVGDRNTLLASTGETGIIKSVENDGVLVEIDNREVRMSKREARTSLALGGVQTGDSAQGQTWERAVVVLIGTETREWLYSAATRGRAAPVFVVMRGDEHDAKSVVETVLKRSGLAQTTEELAKDDAKLSASLAESEPGWVSPSDRRAAEERRLRVTIFDAFTTDAPVEDGTKVKDEPQPEETPAEREPEPREHLVTAIADDKLFRSEREIKRMMSEARKAKAHYEREAAKASVTARDADDTYVVFEAEKLAAMKAEVVEEAKAAIAAKRLREGLLAPLTDAERASVEVRRMALVTAERKKATIEDDSEDRPYGRCGRRHEDEREAGRKPVDHSQIPG